MLARYLARRFACVLALLTITMTAAAQQSIRLYGDVNWTLGTAASDFFRDYRTILGAGAAGFDVPVGLGLGIQSFQLGDGAIGLATGYRRSVVRETYNYDPRTAPTAIGPAQGVGQTILLSVIPALLTIDYIPRHRQFTGYVGAGVGLASVDLSWEEYLTSSQEPGARQSGVRYSDHHLVPAAMVRAGVSLLFDDPFSSETRAGIYVETAYEYVPVSASLMQRIATTLPAAPSQFDQPYNIQAGGIVLRVGFQVMVTSVRR